MSINVMPVVFIVSLKNIFCNIATPLYIQFSRSPYTANSEDKLPAQTHNSFANHAEKAKNSL